MNRPIPTTVLAALLVAAPAAGQQARGLTFVGGIAWEQGGPGASLVESLDAAGFGDTHFAAGRIEYPRYFHAGLNLSVFFGGRYRFDGPYSMEVLVSNGSRGHAEGFRASGPTRLLVQWRSVLVTSTAALNLGPVRIAAGPTLNAMFWDAERNWSSLKGRLTPVVGATAGAGGDFAVADVLVSVRAGVRTFPTIELEPLLSAPVAARYDTYFVGVTVQADL